MRTFARLTLLCASLPLLVCAALAQPSSPRPPQSQQPVRDARCKAAAHKFISVVSDKKHRTVEQQSRVEYDEGRKYLSVCGGLGDGFTRSVREAVESQEAARRCDEMRHELSKPRLLGPQTPERMRENYEASKKFLRVCGGKDERFDAFIRNWLAKYDRAVREFEERRRASEAPSEGPTKEEPE